MTTTENIQITVSTEGVDQLISLVNKLMTAFEKAEKAAEGYTDATDDAATATKELGDDAKDTTRDLDKLSKEANQADKSVDKLEKTTDDAGGGFAQFSQTLGAAVGALAIMEIGAAAVTAAFEFAKEGLNRYNESNVEAKERALDYEGALNSLYLSIGEQIAGNPAFIALQEKMIQLFSEMGDTSSDLGSTLSTILQGAIDGISFAIDAVTYILEAWTTSVDLASGAIDLFATYLMNIPRIFQVIGSLAVELGLAFYEGLGGGINFVLEKMKDLVDAVAPLASRLGLDLSSISEGFDGVSSGVEAGVNSLTQLREGFRDARLDTQSAIIDDMGQSMERAGRAFADATDTAEPAARAIQRIGEDSNTASSGIRTLTTEIEKLAASYDKMAQFADDPKMRTKGQSEEFFAELEARTAAERKYITDSIAAQQEADALALQDTANRIAEEERMADEAASEEEARASKRAEIADVTANNLLSIADTLMSGELKSAKARRKALGDLFAAQGRGYILQSIPEFFINPAKGGALAGAGAGMVALGASLGGRVLGSGGGGGGGSAAAPPAVQGPAANNVTYNIGVNPSPLSDPREIATRVGDVVRTQQRIGG